MDYALIETVEASAVLILKEYRKAHPQWNDDVTPLLEIAAWLKLEVATFDQQDYPQGTYGFMDADEDENLIWLRRDLSTNLLRFTLAHEIGHALFHCQGGRRLLDLAPQYATLLVQSEMHTRWPQISRTQPCQEADVQEDLAGFQEQEQIREVLGAHGYSPRSERELMANIFAAELLMPRARLIALYLHEGIAARKLATRFQVSPIALLNRLAGLYVDDALLTQPPASRIDSTEAEEQTSDSGPTPPPSTKKQYDEFQQAAITAPTPALIVAGPGSGKTSTLIGRVEYLVNTLEVPPRAILALTFSRKATQEMEERLRQILTTDQALQADFPHISTFHAFCADLLREYAAQAGLRDDFTLIDEAEGHYILQQQTDTLRLRHYQKLYSPTFHFSDLLKVISRAKDELVTPDEYAQLAQSLRAQATDEEMLLTAEKVQEIASVYRLYEQELKRRGDTDFGGLLMLAINLLRRYPEIRQHMQERYQHILVDEFQDVNRASGVLLRELAGQEQRVWVVGDANQAIYGFRGASPANIQQFAQDFPAAHVFPLSRNYRSLPDLVTLAEAFRAQHLEMDTKHLENQSVRQTALNAYVTLATANDERHEIAGLIQDMRDKHQQGYAYRDMIVLCRTRAHAQKISRAIASANLPVIEQGGVLDQEHIKDVISLLLLLSNDSGMGLLRSGRIAEHPLSQEDIEAILLSARNTKTSVRQLLRDGIAPLSMSTEGRHSLLRLSEIMRTLMQQAQDTWSLLAQYLLIETNLLRDLLLPIPGSVAATTLTDKQRRARIADYQRLLQMARHFDQQQSQRQSLDNTLPTPTEHASSEEQTATQQHSESKLPLEEQIKGLLEYLSLLVRLRQDNGGRQSSDEEGTEQPDMIRVMTVHASKGLEFPIVYLPGLAQRRFPSQPHSSPVSAPIALLTGMSGGSSHESGEACLFYVGITRARDHLVLSHSERYGKMKYNRSPYLDALESSIPGERITRLSWEHTHPVRTITISNDVTTLFDAEDEGIATAGSQPGEEFINAMRTTQLSVYAIETYQNCPRKYAYGEIYRFSSDPNAYSLFRQATQKTVEEMHRRMESSNEQEALSLPSQEEIVTLYNQHWQTLGGDTMPFATLYTEHGQEIVESVRRQLHTPTNSSQDTARVQHHLKFDVEVAGKTISVPVDRVEMLQEDTQESTNKNTQPVAFVRTRYGQSKEKPPANTRELFYSLAIRKHYPEQKGELHSHNLSTSERVPITMTSRKEQSLYDGIEQAIAGLERNDYTARPNQPYNCPDCPFFWICPA